MSCNTQQLNITCGTDVVLHDRLIFDGETFDPNLSVGIAANLVSSLGKRTALDVQVVNDELLISVPWIDGTLPGCYGLEVTGSCNSKKWATYADSLIKYTKATRIGASEVTVESDSYDITQVVGFRYGEGGNVYDVKVNGVSVVSAGKANITMPTKVSQLTNDSGYQNAQQVAHAIEENLVPNAVVSVDDNTGTPSATVTKSGNTLNFDFKNLKGKPFTYEDFTPQQLAGLVGPKGDQGDSAVYNPDDPDTPDFEMANTTGQSTTKSMTQKAVTDAIYENTHFNSDISSLFSFTNNGAVIGDSTDTNYGKIYTVDTSDRKYSDYVEVTGYDYIRLTMIQRTSAVNTSGMCFYSQKNEASVIEGHYLRDGVDGVKSCFYEIPRGYEHVYIRTTFWNTDGYGVFSCVAGMATTKEVEKIKTQLYGESVDLTNLANFSLGAVIGEYTNAQYGKVFVVGSGDPDKRYCSDFIDITGYDKIILTLIARTSDANTSGMCLYSDDNENSVFFGDYVKGSHTLGYMTREYEIPSFEKVYLKVTKSNALNGFKIIGVKYNENKQRSLLKEGKFYKNITLAGGTIDGNGDVINSNSQSISHKIEVKNGIHIVSDSKFRVAKYNSDVEQTFIGVENGEYYDYICSHCGYIRIMANGNEYISAFIGELGRVADTGISDITSMQPSYFENGTIDAISGRYNGASTSYLRSTFIRCYGKFFIDYSTLGNQTYNVYFYDLYKNYVGYINGISSDSSLYWEGFIRIVFSGSNLTPSSIGDGISMSITNIGLDREEQVLNPFITPVVPAQNSGNQDRLIDLDNASVSDFYNLWDELIDEYPNYLSKRVLGKDTSDTFDIWEIKTTKKVNSSAGTVLFKSDKKILFDCNIHGRPYDNIDSAFTVYYLLRFICKERHTNELAAWLYQNYDFVIIPIANPYGWDNNTYGNVNNVNLNRNFDYKFEANHAYPHPSGQGYTYSGPAPFSEKETQYIRDMILENKDAYVWCDLHSYGDTRKKAMYHGTMQPLSMLRKNKNVFSFVQDRFPSMQIQWYINQDNPGWGTGWVEYSKGIPSINFEVSAFYTTGAKFSTEALTSDLMLLISFLRFQ